MNTKQQRLNNQIAKFIAEIVHYEVYNPDLGFITISEVEVNPDLSLAKVYYMTSGNDKQNQKTQKALETAKGYIRNALAAKLSTRKTPELRFIYDDSLEKAQRIEELIKKTHKSPKDRS